MLPGRYCKDLQRACVLNRYLRVDTSRNPLYTHIFCISCMRLFTMHVPIYIHASVYIGAYFDFFVFKYFIPYWPTLMNSQVLRAEAGQEEANLLQCPLISVQFLVPVDTVNRTKVCLNSWHMLLLTAAKTSPWVTASKTKHRMSFLPIPTGD